MADGRSILIIDGEPKTRDTLHRMFSDSGCEACPESDGRRGLRAAEKREFSVVILDMGLARTDGLELLRRLRERWEDMPVIMIAPRGSELAAVEALRLGAYDYVTRPFELGEMQIVAERAIEHRRLIDENRLLRNELKTKHGLDNDAPAGTNSPASQDLDPAEVVAVTASLRDAELSHVRRVLRHTEWNQSAAAQVLGIDRKTLRNKIREFRLRK